MHTYSGSRIHSEEKVVIHCTAHLLSLLSGKSGPSKGALDFFFSSESGVIAHCLRERVQGPSQRR